MKASDTCGFAYLLFTEDASAGRTTAAKNVPHDESGPDIFVLGRRSRKIAYFWVVPKVSQLVFRSGRFGEHALLGHTAFVKGQNDSDSNP